MCVMRKISALSGPSALTAGLCGRREKATARVRWLAENLRLCLLLLLGEVAEIYEHMLGIIRLWIVLCRQAKVGRFLDGK